MLLLLLLPAPVSAADTWTNVAPGIDWLHRVDSGSTPQDVHAVRVDLSRETIGLRASMDASGSERAVTTSTFASNVGAIVAINGDWSASGTPVGLAIGNGWLWRSHYDDASIGGTWGYLACDVFNTCTIDALPPLSEAWWFGSPTISPYRYYNAVGANGLVLIEEGVRSSGCYDGCSGDVCRHPRSAACTSADGETLWLVQIDGRRSSASGMTCEETRDLLEGLGCWNAAMLDGGGSSTIWIDGAVRNQPSDGSQCSTANHFGVISVAAPSSQCRLVQGAWCEGSQLHTCNGGVLVNEGDCAYFGTTCQEDGSWAFCVDPRCPGGDGTAASCLDATRVAACTDGVYGEGDCGVFGLVCGTDAAGSSCMDPACEAGPNSGFCTVEGWLTVCAEGAIASSGACPQGTSCVESGGTASCVDPDAPVDTGTSETSGDGGGGAGEGDGGAPEGEGGVGERQKEGEGCRCSAGGAPGLGALLGALGLLVRRRRGQRPPPSPPSPER